MRVVLQVMKRNVIKKFKKQLGTLSKGGFFHILSGNVLNNAISMISSIVLARVIDKVEYAYISYADNLYAYIALLSGLGMSTAILKFCGADHDKELDKGYLIHAVKYGGLFELVASIALCIIANFSNIPYPRARIYLWALCIYPMLSHVYNTFLCYIRTQYENKRYALSGIIQSSSVCALSIILVLLLGTGGVIFARYLSVLIVILYLGLYIYKRIGTKTAIHLNRCQRRDFNHMSISLVTASLFSGIMPINETFLVNHIIRDAATTANFKVAGFFPQMLMLFSGAITVYYFPIIAQMKDWEAIRKKVLRIGAFTFCLLLLLAGIGMLLTPFAIRLLYGEKYVESIPMTYMLWGMRAMNGCIRVVPMNMLPAVGKARFNAWTATISCFVQVVVDYLLISQYGISGVAWGAMIVYAVSGICYWCYFLWVSDKEIRKNKVHKFEKQG